MSPLESQNGASIWNVYLQRAFDNFLEEGTQAIAVKSSVSEKKRRYCRVFGLILISGLPNSIICKQSRAGRKNNG